MNCNHIELSPPELEAAAEVGSRRHIEALKRRLPDKHGYAKADPWQIHIEGACGELAAAKALGLPWDGPVNTFRRGGDVGDLQVRTRSNHDWDLLIRPKDRPDDVFILVTGVAPSYVVRGWILGKHAQVPKYLKEYGGRPPAFFVPQRDLRPISELIA